MNKKDFEKELNKKFGEVNKLIAKQYKNKTYTGKKNKEKSLPKLYMQTLESIKEHVLSSFNL